MQMDVEQLFGPVISFDKSRMVFVIAFPMGGGDSTMHADTDLQYLYRLSQICIEDQCLTWGHIISIHMQYMRRLRYFIYIFLQSNKVELNFNFYSFKNESGRVNTLSSKAFW